MEKSGNTTDAVVAICPSQEIRVDIDPWSTRLFSIDVFDNCWPSMMRFCQGLLVLKSNVLSHESEMRHQRMIVMTVQANQQLNIVFCLNQVKMP
jgi:hypothetical protein